MYRRNCAALRRGAVLDFAAFQAHIVESTKSDGPSVVRFRFRVPLEHESLVFVAWRDGRYTVVAPPATGRTLELERVSLQRLL